MRLLTFTFVLFVQIFAMSLTPVYFFIWLLSFALNRKMLSFEYILYPLPLGALFATSFGIILYLRHTKDRKDDTNRFKRKFVDEFFCHSVFQNWSEIEEDLKTFGYKNFSIKENVGILTIECERPRSPVHPWRKNGFLSERSILITVIPQESKDLIRIEIKPSKWYQYGDFTESSYFLQRELKSYFEKKFPSSDGLSILER